MNASDRGTKHRCSSCGAPFYDLNRSPIICPKCGADYVPEERLARAPARTRSATRAPRPAPEAEPVTEIEAEEEEAFDEDEIATHDEDEDEAFTPRDEGDEGDELRG